MLKSISIVSVIAFAALFIAGLSETKVPKEVLDRAAFGSPQESADAIATLRKIGPAGLNALLEIDPKDDSAKFTRAIDEVAQQRDASFSRLFWYTNLDEAKAASKSQGNKPILSLRLLGNLNEEFSCANSRYFRTALYANAKISAYLRKHYILHWQSERPAPHITVDMGDGRKIERTITGNSIHYVLNSDGDVVDAIPGLYGPGAFLKILNDAASTIAGGHAIQDYHHRTADELGAMWRSDMKELGVMVGGVGGRLEAGYIPVAKHPTAYEATPRAVSKGRVEITMVQAFLPESSRLAAFTTDPLWNRLAELHRADAILDGRSIELMTTKTKLDETSMKPVVKNFESAMAMDTVRNQYLMRLKIHEWLSMSSTPMSLESLNTRVYTELFLTPRSDPWLGLVPADIYTGLPVESTK